MGTYKQGILGSFLGKVGNVVGSSWRGISYMRSLATSVANPRTAAQVSNRDLFALVVTTIRPFLYSLRKGFIVGTGNSQWSAAVSRNIDIQRAEGMAGEEWEFDYTKLALSNGAEQFSPTFSGDIDLGLSVSWSVGSDSPLALGVVYVVLFDRTIGSVETFHTDVSAGQINISASGIGSNDEVALYVFAATSKYSSETIYHSVQ